MDLLKKLYNVFFNVDYIIKDSTKLIKLRKKIINSNKDIFSKIITQIMVIIVNYLFSKLIIFKKKK